MTGCDWWGGSARQSVGQQAGAAAQKLCTAERGYWTRRRWHGLSRAQAASAAVRDGRRRKRKKKAVAERRGMGEGERRTRRTWRRVGCDVYLTTGSSGSSP